ncbi:sulfolipid-1 biosynthesis phthioceranic/hydroxyphthioceranic acid synthase [Streptomyces sp. S816]|uniref:sulfolipid-1 biosynthesis phthioceranic/hydroxyphthioceranic acid synthase n=1 Tax=Streptomyces sp. S816 TaxID=2283197 RepID=UPI0032B4EE61
MCRLRVISHTYGKELPLRAIPVAVIGIGCRLPGGVNSPDVLWKALRDGADTIGEIPADRWDAEEHYSPEVGASGGSVSRWGAFLEDIQGFDAAFFGIGDSEARAMDPQHRLLLETAWEAVESSGLPPSSLAGTSTGVFVGQSHDDYTLLSLDAGVLDGPYGFTGNAWSMASGRIAFALDLKGPGLTVDTSCSSGLMAVHLACRSLAEGECETALAGGGQVVLAPEVSTSASAQGMLSPTGRCRAFDASADGFVRSEGFVMVFLKRLEDARRDGDRILAVIRGTAVNQDGRTGTITKPSQQAQSDVYRAALAAAGVAAETVGMVEAHGTGTPVGDPIEFTSLSEVYGRDGVRCALGSVKSNFGHTEAAAGVLGLAKAVLAVFHGVVPASLHFTALPEQLRTVDSGLFVPTSPVEWPVPGGVRRAAVSSFGMTGTNVHAVLEQAPDPEPPCPADTAGPWEDMLFPVSSSSVEELRATARRLADWAEAREGEGEREGAAPVEAREVAYTLARRRGHRPVRAAALAPDLSGLAARLREIAEDDTLRPCVQRGPGGPVLVFSGQGSQWGGMGRDLLAREPAYAAAVDEIEPLIAGEAGFSVREAMTCPETVTGIERVQPVLFAMQIGMAAALRARGVVPGGVIGHSMGEVGAAVVAGALTLEDGVKVICRRSELCARIAGAGAMASVELPAVEVREELERARVEDVVVSVIASPLSTVIGGGASSVRRLVRAWEERGVMAREVAVDVASHSPQVDPILDDLAKCLTDLTPGSPAVRYYSACLDSPSTAPGFDAAYWVDNLRRPVRFAGAVRAALDDGHRVFVELAPHPLLTRAVEQTAEAHETPAEAIACMRRGVGLPQGLAPAVGQVFTAGAAVDFAAWYPSGRLLDVPLPSWTHRHLFVRPADRDAAGPGRGGHPLLTAHVRLPEPQERHAWQGDVGAVPLPWLADHKVGGLAALPGAAYCEMALTAARALFGEGAVATDIRFEDLLTLDAHTTVVATGEVQEAGTALFTVHTNDDDTRTVRATATLKAADAGPAEEPAPLDVPALLAAHTGTIEGEALRDMFAARGVQLGPAFAAVTRVHTGDGHRTTLAELALPPFLHRSRSDYGVHPVLLDACFQSVAAHPSLTGPAAPEGLLLPLGADSLHVFGPLRQARYCRARLTGQDRHQVSADLDVVDEYGAVLMRVRGFRMGGGDCGGLDCLLPERLMAVDWIPRPLPPAPVHADGDRWLVVAEDEALTASLTAALEAGGARCTTVSATPDSAASLSAYRGVVFLPPAPAAAEPHEESVRLGREYVKRLVRVARCLLELRDPPRLFAVTRAAQHVRDEDPVSLDHAGLRGLARVIGVEQPALRVTHIDLAAGTRDGSAVAQELLADEAEDETAWRDGSRYAARLRIAPFAPQERFTATVRNDSAGVRCGIRVPGDLDTLELRQAERIPPGPGEIEVAVTAASVNFADVLAALGRGFAPDARDPELGVDFAGTVTAVGAGVSGHRVGDRVAGVPSGDRGTWGTFVTCDARLAMAVPGDLTDEQGAAVPAAYLTAWYALHTLGRIGRGERVLIHSATGGLGRAAIAVARAAGAEIHATAGSPQRRLLLREMGIEHVYDSRSLAFAEQIRAVTGGDGVDLVLNSLTGPAQRAGLEVLAHGGRFLEVGKRDVYENTRLGLYPFRRNISFHLVDLNLLRRMDPDRIQALLCEVLPRIADGTLPKPLVTSYPLRRAAEAVREISNARHDGKLVLQVDRSGTSKVTVPPERVPVFRPDGAYLITGGLGGLGLFLAERLAAAGCGRIVLTSRSKPDDPTWRKIEEIRARGADLQVECGDVAQPGTARRLVEAACATGLPLRGVLHAAAVVEDATLANISDEIIDRDWAPKAYGAWHLHRASAEQPLDWFCCFSSGAALLGSPGQGAYAAANSWLDAFTHWRRSQGLPAHAIAWGAWTEIGRARALGSDRVTAVIKAEITPDEGAHAFETILRHTRAFTGYARPGSAPWLTALAERSPFAAAFRGRSDDGRDTHTVLQELRGLSAEERPARLRRLLCEQAGAIARTTVDPDRPFDGYGLDSLGTLELRVRLQAHTGVRLTSRDLATHRTARALANHLLSLLAFGTEEERA